MATYKTMLFAAILTLLMLLTPAAIAGAEASSSNYTYTKMNPLEILKVSKFFKSLDTWASEDGDDEDDENETDDENYEDDEVDYSYDDEEIIYYSTYSGDFVADGKQLPEDEKNYFTLLDTMKHYPKQRDQGYCGNCWVWAGTALLENELYAKEGIKDRLSVQYFDSYYSDDYYTACTGGWVSYLTDTYAEAKKLVPWSNDNANYHDYGGWSYSKSAIDASAINDETYYPIDSIKLYSVPTLTADSDEQAKDNIKAALREGKAVALSFFLPDGDSWNDFYNYWFYGSNEDVWNPSQYCGRDADFGTGGHAVVIVGYDERDSENPYWIVLNSWGTADGNRRDGTYKLAMDLDYKCDMYYFGLFPTETMYFEVVDVKFGNDKGIKISPLADDSIMPNLKISNEYVAAGDVLEGSAYIENSEPYMKIGDITVTWSIQELGVWNKAGISSLDADEGEIMKKIQLDIPKDAMPGEYPVRITISSDGYSKTLFRFVTVR